MTTDNKNGEFVYDHAAATMFLAMAFKNMTEEEKPMTWVRHDAFFGKPVSPESLLKKMQRTSKPAAFYVSTMTINADDEMRNIQGNFAGLHFIVLDDIGTKVDPAKLPDDLIPNMIIETSKGNYQWVFFLSEPIRDLAVAKAFVRVVYSSGMTDTGGCMPNKMVRLPAGINNKITKVNGEEKRNTDIVRLVGDVDEHPWHPADLLDHLNCGITFDQLKEDAQAYTKAHNTAFRQGTSAWSPVATKAPSATGEVDPLLEWMYEQEMVVSDPTPEGWITIKCPWCHEHTTGDETAGYNPLGLGDNPNTRGYHCFHDHCSDKHTGELIDWAIEQGGPEVAVKNDIADMVADFAFIVEGSRVVKVRGARTMRPIRLEDFKNKHRHRNVRQHYIDPNTGKVVNKLRGAADLWLSAPNVLRLHAERYEVTNPARVVEHDGELWLNTYEPPRWGTGTWRKDHVKIFLRYLMYRVPNKDQRRYFLQWLACKMDNPDFRGAAVLMVTPTKGTGRSTLGDLIRNMINECNCSETSFDTLVGEGPGSQYNEWQQKLMVVCPEVWSNNPRINKFKAMETIKGLIDPRPTKTTINVKWGSKNEQWCYSSYLLLSNHTDAIGALGDDRRIYVIENPTRRKRPRYYKMISEYFSQNKDDFACSIYRFLRQEIKYDRLLLESPAPMTDAKRRMVDETTSPVGSCIEWWFKNVSKVLPQQEFRNLMVDAFGALDMGHEEHLIGVAFSGAMREHTSTLPPNIRVSPIEPGGSRIRLRVSRKDMGWLPQSKNKTKRAVDEEAAKLRPWFKSDDTKAELTAMLTDALRDALS